jgi:hypothetical protein
MPAVCSCVIITVQYRRLYQSVRLSGSSSSSSTVEVIHHSSNLRVGPLWIVAVKGCEPLKPNLRLHYRIVKG